MEIELHGVALASERVEDEELDLEGFSASRCTGRE